MACYISRYKQELAVTSKQKKTVRRRTRQYRPSSFAERNSHILLLATTHGWRQSYVDYPPTDQGIDCNYVRRVSLQIRKIGAGELSWDYLLSDNVSYYYLYYLVSLRILSASIFLVCFTFVVYSGVCCIARNPGTDLIPYCIQNLCDSNMCLKPNRVTCDSIYYHQLLLDERENWYEMKEREGLLKVDFQHLDICCPIDAHQIEFAECSCYTYHCCFFKTQLLPETSSGRGDWKGVE